jgi:hypothetical protein
MRIVADQKFKDRRSPSGRRSSTCSRNAAANYQRSSRDVYLQRLGARELVEARGREVKASDHSIRLR